jgi:endonuclease/exonuclease/phosphatase family metal-dependent hydrolase
MLMHPKLYPFCLSLAACLAVAVIGCRVQVEESTNPAVDPGKPGEYLFCHWNVENFFDDKHDKRTHKADKEYDEWFADNPDVLKLKLEKLTEGLLKMNGGRGPDILSICEVESTRAADLLMEALNKKLDAKYHYKHVLMKNLNAGRHIAPAIITRLPVKDDKTKLLGKQLRILEGHVVADGKELIIFATHWTSRIQTTGEHGREHYGETVYKAFKAYHDEDPKVCVLVCGDFNDTPQDESVVRFLHSSDDLTGVKQAKKEPLLYNLFASKDAKDFGTHNYNGKWFIFDQILVSAGMLDGGAWTCQVDTAATFNELHNPRDPKKRPWRFGDPDSKGERGYSDHFPVTVKLRVN